MKILVNTFETLVTLISKWPGISKIYPPILDYRMLCALSNDLLVFGSSHGTPCSIVEYTTETSAKKTSNTVIFWTLIEPKKIPLNRHLGVNFGVNNPQELSLFGP